MTRMGAGHRDGVERQMSILVKRILAVALVAGFGFSLAACETAAGFGRDVEKLGEQIQEGVDK